MKFMRSSVVAICAALVLSGCISTEQPRSSGPSGSEAARSGGTLTIGITDPGSLSPFDAVTPSAKLISRAMCDTLVMLDPDTNQTVEGLLDSWVLAEDGRFITLRPQHRLQFNDGTVLKAPDLNTGLIQLAARVNGSAAAGLGNIFGGGVLAKSGPSAAAKNENLLIDSGQAAKDAAQPLNDYDAQVKAADHNGRALRSFAEPAMAPISGAAFAADPDAFRGNPVCVGPYHVEKPYRQGDQSITLVRTTGYHARNLGYTAGGAGYADRMVFKIFENAAASYEAYQKGEVDVTQVPGDTVLPATTPGIVPGTYPGVEYVGVSTLQGAPYDNIALRRALSMVTDRAALAETFLGASGEPATGFLPPSLAIKEGVSGRGKKQPGLTLPTCPNVPTKPDVAAAQKILRDAGVDPKTVTVEVFVNTDADKPLRDLYPALAEQWTSALGVTVALRDSSLYSDLYVAGPVGIGRWLYRYSWSSDAVSPVPVYNDPQAYLNGMFGNDGVTDYNWTGWTNPALSKLLAGEGKLASSAQDQQLRIAPTMDALCTDMPLIPIANRRIVWLVRPDKVEPARTHYAAPDGQPLLRELYLP